MKAILAEMRPDLALKASELPCAASDRATVHRDGASRECEPADGRWILAPA